MDTTVSSMFDGDAVLFYCLEASGYVYSEPISSESNIVTVYPAKENLPDFPNINFAAFLISHRKLQSVSLQRHNLSHSQNAEPMTVVYGSIIKIQHQASGRYLAATPNNSAWLNEGDSEANLFRLVSSHQEKGWGDDLAINDNIILESIYYKGYKIQCINNPIEARDHLVLSGTGSVFSIKPHCYKCSTLNPQYILGGNVIMLSSLKIDGYVSVKGSFVNDKLPDQFKWSHNEVGLRRWRQKFFKALPVSGDTFFQLEKTIHIWTGNPFVFGEECRIKHLPTQQYISVKDTSDRLKIVVESMKKSNGAELFKILPTNIFYSVDREIGDLLQKNINSFIEKLNTEVPNTYFVSIFRFVSGF
ncbi:PREDICTED: uncharacterized protein LOC109589021 [Amphimedon queenslandica]|uniref:MIR domain-containing protein n=1 Tax=Amphimedon queenslandica TaxID=400682 RepID=A0AAN0JU79_AMPQE|nr:PREDICTED: uncharacterized protein LOC109589021 [Amphimedon queenslandica]|eukprot:XP_019860701.1 PREDICTED: uncharacterized protein LOC109589021 [Amphimedon queenslandica]